MTQGKAVPLREVVKVVSGGQTGVDRAALDAALACGLPVGGWCPQGRQAEDGPLAARYPLRETPLLDPAQRTVWNVRDSDGTLVLLVSEPAGGTALTVAEAVRMGRPLLVLSLARPRRPEVVLDWMAEHAIRVLNVAGPRESEAPGLYALAFSFLEAVFLALPDRGP
jgi:hypothetical protein